MPVSLVRKRVRLVMVAGALLLAFYLLYTARGALAPFFLGSVFVLVFAPVVDAIAAEMPFRERHPGLALSLSIALVYLIFSGLILLAVLAWGSAILREGKDLANGLPSLVERARREVQDNNGWYQQNVPPEIRSQVDQNWQLAAVKLGEYAQTVVSRTIGLATDSVAMLVSYIVVPFWVFFVLKDRQRGMRSLVALFPPAIQPDVEHLVSNARVVFGSYLRAQLLLSTATGIITVIGLQWFGIRFAFALGLIAAVANLIPVLGPMIGGIPALIVVTATRPGWDILWVFLFLFVSQELKDFILVPRIQGRAVRLHPAIILVLIVVAGRFAGFWGLLLAVPVSAVLRDSFVYIHRRLLQGDAPDDSSGIIVTASEADFEEELPRRRPRSLRL